MTDVTDDIKPLTLRIDLKMRVDDICGTIDQTLLGEACAQLVRCLGVTGGTLHIGSDAIPIEKKRAQPQDTACKMMDPLLLSPKDRGRVLRDIQFLLWGEGENSEWDGETLQLIAHTMRQAGLAPKDE